MLETMYQGMQGEKSLPPEENPRRSQSRSRFTSWRKRCLQKSSSLDQSQLQELQHHPSPSGVIRKTSKNDSVEHPRSKDFSFHSGRKESLPEQLRSRKQENVKIRRQRLSRQGNDDGFGKEQIPSTSRSYPDDGGIWKGDEDSRVTEPAPDVTFQTKSQPGTKMSSSNTGVDLLQTLEALPTKLVSSSPPSTIFHISDALPFKPTSSGPPLRAIVKVTPVVPQDNPTGTKVNSFHGKVKKRGISVPDLARNKSNSLMNDKNYKHVTNGDKTPQETQDDGVSLPWFRNLKSPSVRITTDETFFGQNVPGHSEAGGLATDIFGTDNEFQEVNNATKTEGQNYPSWFSSTGDSIWRMVRNTLKDFSADSDDEDDDSETEDGPAFKVKKLKENVVRFSTLVHHVYSVWADAEELVLWHRPTKTAVSLGLLLHALVYEWWLSGILGLMLLRLSLSYVDTVKWTFHFNKFRNCISIATLKIHTKICALWARLREKVSSVTNLRFPSAAIRQQPVEDVLEADGLTQALKPKPASHSNLEDFFKCASRLKPSSEQPLGSPRHKTPTEQYPPSGDTANSLSHKGQQQEHAEKKDKKDKSNGKEKLKSSSTKEKTDQPESLGERLVFLLQVARRAQNLLGKVSDGADRLSMLLHWHHPNSSTLNAALWLLFLCSVVTPPHLLIKWLLVALAIKTCVTDGLVGRYPRFKKKLVHMWRSWRGYDEAGHKAHLSSDNERQLLLFRETFALPLAESPLQGWSSGRRCTLVNRDRSLPSAFRNGRLFLTPSYLCFERSRSQVTKNLTIALRDIESILKAESYSWIPGGGMAIEICLKSSVSGPAQNSASPKTGGEKSPAIVPGGGPHRSQDDEQRLGPSSPGNHEPAILSTTNRSEVVDGGEDPRIVVLDGRLKEGTGAENCEGRLESGQQHLTVSGGRFYLTPPENGVSVARGSVVEVDGHSSGTGNGDQVFGFDVASVNIRKLSKKKKHERQKKYRPQSYFFGSIRNRDEVYDQLVQAISRLQADRADTTGTGPAC